ncbi:MAG TPA: hypothetical protein VG347_08700 [Verrucomicrobiae bacterium]|nr:hypothetical protein [Verrucomicrobiae bacterium]
MAGLGQAPVFTNATIVGGNFKVQILIASNATFTIQTSTNLTSWTSVGFQTATNNLMNLVDPRGIAGFGRQYYRLLLGGGSSGSQVKFNFGFLEFANAGNYGAGSTPATTFPVTLNSYSATFGVQNDTNYPGAANIFFTGPAGSGLTNSPANPDNSNTNAESANYQSAYVTNPFIAPGGTWVANYKGTNETFSVPDPQAASRVVVPYPTVTVVGGVLQSVNWVYRDAATGATLGGPPAYMSNIQVQVHGASSAGELYDSDQLTPATTSNVVASPVSWAAVSGISMAYGDSLGNNYVISFGGPASGH